MLQLLTREGFIRLLTLFGRNGQAIGTSALAAWAKKVLDLDVPENVREKIDNMVDDIYNSIEERMLMLETSLACELDLRFSFFSVKLKS